jgi:Ca2+/H+ antiporter, TMEM165/GDT1 family
VESFLASISSVTLAEIGDRTQILSLMLAARYRQPWPILAGVLCATLANHMVAGLVGVHLGRFLTPRLLDGIVGASLLGMALWTLKPDSLADGKSETPVRGAFVTTVITFFIAEIGDKTEVATMALAAAYSTLVPVVAGSTAGMLIANAPVVFLGKAFSERLPLRAIRYVASGLFIVLGALFLWRAFQTVR